MVYTGSNHSWNQCDGSNHGLNRFEPRLKPVWTIFCFHVSTKKKYILNILSSKHDHGLNRFELFLFSCVNEEKITIWTSWVQNMMVQTGLNHGWNRFEPRFAVWTGLNRFQPRFKPVPTIFVFIVNEEKITFWTSWVQSMMVQTMVQTGSNHGQTHS
jgi:hypothetical protein